MAGALSRVVVVSGLSGAGKTTAIKALEDMGFYCVDNLPVVFFERFLSFCGDSGKELVALGVDVRDREGITLFRELFPSLKSRDGRLFLLFLEAEDAVLLRRFKETRRFHPLWFESFAGAIKRERELLAPIRAMADRVVDTSGMNAHALRRCVFEMFHDVVDSSFQVFITSFSFREGIPPYLDLVFDVRGLPNPYYVDELKEKTGMDEGVSSFVFSDPDAEAFFRGLSDFLLLSIESLRGDGRLSVSVGVGCTGGKHRSVAVCERLGKILVERGYRVSIYHRELNHYRALLG